MEFSCVNMTFLKSEQQFSCSIDLEIENGLSFLWVQSRFHKARDYRLT